MSARHLVAVAMAFAAHHVEAQVPAGTLERAALWFDAKATLGAFRGITHTARGRLESAPDLARASGFVESPSASLSTDNRIRDRDMRKTLEVEKFPAIRFDLDSVAIIGEERDSTRVELVGRMSVHGVTRPERIPAVVRRPSPTRIHVTGAFDMFLPNYGVKNLKRMLGTLTMDETIRVGIDVTFNKHPTNEEDELQ